MFDLAPGCCSFACVQADLGQVQSSEIEGKDLDKKDAEVAWGEANLPGLEDHRMDPDIIGHDEDSDVDIQDEKKRLPKYILDENYGVEIPGMEVQYKPLDPDDYILPFETRISDFPPDLLHDMRQMIRREFSRGLCTFLTSSKYNRAVTWERPRRIPAREERMRIKERIQVPLRPLDGVTVAEPVPDLSRLLAVGGPLEG